jgi:diacylglycerol kinase (ATP)
VKTVLVANPTKVRDPEELCATVALRGRALGLPGPALVTTTVEDPGEGVTRRAVEGGAGLVLSAGGDGTVMAVARGLAGTGVPLGVLPAGTGNLLARNLGLPLDLDAAVDAALQGPARRIDLGLARRDGGPPEGFVVMAGTGFDAAMMDDAPVRLKAVLGWPAYVVSGLRHLRDRPVRVELRVDDGPVLVRRTRCVVVGNVGTLQGGVRLLPDAAPDDGLLDVVLLSPRGVAAWVRVVLHLATAGADDRAVERFRGRRVELHAERPQPAQLDGDPAGLVRSLVLEVLPGALLVRGAGGP